jgi:hypothetical protein
MTVLCKSLKAAPLECRANGCRHVPEATEHFAPLEWTPSPHEESRPVFEVLKSDAAKAGQKVFLSGASLARNVETRQVAVVSEVLYG